jgi:SAM-dependent methyltransferase
MFREALLAVPPEGRDAWLDAHLGLAELPDDAPLPQGCVPYLPCGVDELLCIVDEAPVRATDVVVDIGSGVGRAAAFVQLLAGARVLGIEIQPALAARARALAVPIETIEGDAALLADTLARGTVFLLYCPFGGERLVRVLAALEAIALSREICVCCVDLPLPPCPWLVRHATSRDRVAIYRSPQK